MRAYSYLRFSTPEQAAGDSFRRQSDAAQAYCREHELTLDTELTFHDLGVSAFRGDNAETGRLGDFLRAVEDGMVPKGSWLLVESLDRISRATPRKAVRLLEDIVDMGITVVTLSDRRVYDRKTLDEDPLAFLAAFLVAIRANEESAIKQRRLKAAWSAKRASASDRPLTSICPAWLRLDGTKFVLIEDRVEVVRRIFQLAANGSGASSIAGTLNTERIPPFGRASMWYPSYIKKILGNRAVVGDYTPHTLEREKPGPKRRIPQATVTGYYPPVVSSEQFDDVTTQRLGRATGARSGKGVASLVASLARCASCGAAMTRVMKGSSAKAGRNKLVCTRARGKAGCSDYRTIKLENVELTFINSAEYIAAHCPVTNIDADEKLNTARTAVESVEYVVGLLVDEMISSPSSVAIRERLAASEKALGEAREQLREAEQNALLYDRVDINRRLDEMIQILRADPLDKAKGNAALRRLFSKIVVDPVEVALHWHHAPDAAPMYLLHSMPKTIY